MNSDEAIKRLERQVSEIEALGQVKRGTPEFKTWHRNTEVAIEKIFGENTRHIGDFRKVSYGLNVASSSTPEARFQKAYTDGLDRARAVLNSMVQEVAEYGIEASGSANNENGDDGDLAAIENICDRFHTVSRQLRGRYDDRPTLEIDDEYDVQDLLHALLLVEFDDVRREDPAPTQAGGASRIDIVLKKEKIVIEVKKTRQGLDARKLGAELIIDIERYRSHPSCETLVCFVYDPEARIANPRGIERDLSGERDGLKVVVIIAP